MAQERAASEATAAARRARFDNQSTNREAGKELNTHGLRAAPAISATEPYSIRFSDFSMRRFLGVMYCPSDVSDRVEYHHRIPADHHRIPTLLWSPEDPRTLVVHQKVPALLWLPQDPGAKYTTTGSPRERRATFWLTRVGVNHKVARPPSTSGAPHGER